MAEKEKFDAYNEDNRKKTGWNPVIGTAMVIESAERNTYSVEVANSGKRKVEELDVKSPDLMAGKITTIVALDDSIQESKVRNSKGEDKDI